MLVLAPILMLSLIAHLIVGGQLIRYPDNYENDLKLLDSITQSIERNLVKINHSKDSIPERAIVSSFNPNLVNRKWLLTHGVQPLLAASWANYLAKGGKFYRAKDLSKLYGINDSIYHYLQPLIKIPKSQTSSAKLNLNHADTSQLMQRL